MRVQEFGVEMGLGFGVGVLRLKAQDVNPLGEKGSCKILGCFINLYIKSRYLDLFRREHKVRHTSARKKKTSLS